MGMSKGIVYIVEDNHSFRKSTERLVRSIGYDVAAFESAEAFLFDADIQCPGCLLLDIRLPDIDGIELQMLLHKKGCNLPVIFMTGHGDIPMSVNAMKRGAVDFLPKPFDPHDLKVALINALARSTHEMHEECKKE